MPNPVELWKAEKHGFDVWPDVERHAAASTPSKAIDAVDLERMKWYGFFYRKRDVPSRYMNRIRITACELSADQAREIAHIAYDYGHGIIDVTTRANVQVQGLDISHLPKVTERLQQVGLTSKQTGHDNIRNVFAHPFSGLLPDEIIDTRPLCHNITKLFLDSREYSNLPRKFNICLDGTERHSSHFWTQDISYLATRSDEGDVLFQVLIGGTQGQNPHLAWHLPVCVEPSQVVDMTRVLLDLFRVKGSREKRNAARFRFLVDRIGVGGILEWLEEKLSFRLQPYIREPIPPSSHDELVGWFRQKDPRLWTMGLCVPLGRLTWRQLEGLALLAKKWGDGHLRTTHEQGMAVINIPGGFKETAATDAAALSLSMRADSFDLGTMACTGSQFCNIAVTETKGQMFQLVEKLRKRALKLHGIRIHMNGCPSSCAQHFTADIGLKGVRVRRLIGTRQGFDVFLGGGIAGQIHLALPYRLGVDADQLPTLVEEVVHEFYLRHKAGQTFSAYWREKLQAEAARKVGGEDYRPPVWICDNCEYRHVGEDPPVYCPSCAGLRRLFARIDDTEVVKQAEKGTVGQPDKETAEQRDTEETQGGSLRDAGFVLAAKNEELTETGGLLVEVLGREYALFRVERRIVAIEAACPHEGAELANGDFQNGIVTCPSHGWTFNVCTGCSIDPPGSKVQTFETLLENGNIFIKPAGSAPASAENPPIIPWPL